jgi:hypothetical protein
VWTFTAMEASDPTQAPYEITVMKCAVLCLTL